MNDQKKFGLQKLLLTIAILLPIIYFGYIIVYSNSNSQFVPKYNFIYVTDKTDSGCNQGTYNYDPETGLQKQAPQKKILLENKKLSLITTTSGDFDYKSKFCNDEFYLFDVNTNTAKLLIPESLINYTMVSNTLDDSNRKDPDNFEFKDGSYTNNISPIFYEGYNYDKPTYSLTKKFSNKILNVPNGRIRFLGFVNN